MLQAIKGFMRERRNRVREDDVVDRLSFNTWKTYNRILEEVEAARQSKGEEPPVSRDEAFWYSPKIDTRMVLTRLLIRGIVEMKHESELTGTETVWASKSDSSADDQEAQFREDHGYGELAFYRFTGSARKRKPKEDELPEGALSPMVV